MEEGKCSTKKVVDVQSLVEYKREPCEVLKEIKLLVREIISQCPQYDDGKKRGWILAKKHWKHWTDDDHKVAEYAFVLDASGNFVCYESEYSNYNEKYDSGFAYSESSFSELMMEFDFDYYCDYTYNSGDVVSFAFHKIPNAYETIERKYKKGYGLYYKLLELKNNKILPIVIEKPRQEEHSNKTQNCDKIAPNIIKEQEKVPKKSFLGIEIISYIVCAVLMFFNSFFVGVGFLILLLFMIIAVDMYKDGYCIVPSIVASVVEIVHLIIMFACNVHNPVFFYLISIYIIIINIYCSVCSYKT